jgi:myosin heavy subunit
MPDPTLNRPPQRNGSTLIHPPASSATPGLKSPKLNADSGTHSSGQEVLQHDAYLRQEMTRLSEENRNLLTILGSGSSSGGPAGNEAQECERLRAENAELRRTIAELEELINSDPSGGAKAWAEKEKEYDSLLEQKSEVIRSLHLKIQELQEQAPAKAGPLPPNEEELQAVCDELERERTQLDLERREIQQDRAQLQEDEESLMKQMREMEMAMSRERAELARQRNDLQRLHNDIKHELELAARDASLRDRLVGLQRRHQDITTRKGASPVASPASAPPSGSKSPPPQAPPRKESSGILGRLFGSGK